MELERRCWPASWLLADSAMCAGGTVSLCPVEGRDTTARRGGIALMEFPESLTSGWSDQLHGA